MVVIILIVMGLLNQLRRPAANVLDALAVLMGWSGDCKQIVTKVTEQSS